MRKTLILIITFLTCLSLFSVTAYAATANKNIASNVKSNESSFAVTEFGAKGNDDIDDTEAIQNALNKYDKVYIPAGTYMIDVDKSLVLNSNQTLLLDRLAILKALPTTNENSSVLKIKDVSGVNVSGGQIIGERYGHLGSTGEWGMGILVESANKVKISNVTISDCWGDGLYVGGTTPANGIKIDGVVSSNNRRQGLSITNATNVTISNSVFKNTNGTAPEAGIDIEPNPGEIAEDITIVNTKCYSNAGSGIDLMGINETVKRVTVKGCTISDNSSIGIRLVKATDSTFSNNTITNNLFGIEIPRDTSNIRFTNMNISNNKSRGVSIVATTQAKGIENIVFENSVFSNNSQSKIGDTDGIRIDNFDSTGYINNISFSNCKFVDNQTVKTQRYGMTVGFTEKITNIKVNANNVFSGNVVGGLLGSNKAVVKGK